MVTVARKIPKYWAVLPYVRRHRYTFVGKTTENRPLDGAHLIPMLQPMFSPQWQGAGRGFKILSANRLDQSEIQIRNVLEI